jgi:hypothetical protein
MSLIGGSLETVLGILAIALSILGDEAGPGLGAGRSAPARSPRLWERGRNPDARTFLCMRRIEAAVSLGRSYSNIRGVHACQ